MGKGNVRYQIRRVIRCLISRIRLRKSELCRLITILLTVFFGFSALAVAPEKAAKVIPSSLKEPVSDTYFVFGLGLIVLLLVWFCIASELKRKRQVMELQKKLKLADTKIQDVRNKLEELERENEILKLNAEEFFKNEDYEIRALDWDLEPIAVGADENEYLLPFTDKKKIETLRNIETEFSVQIDTYLSKISTERDFSSGKNLGKLSDARQIWKSVSGDKFERLLEKETYFINRNSYDRVVVIGDIHGSEMAVRTILQQTDFFQSVKEGNRDLFIVLGDYIDRGAESLWVLYHLLKLKNSFPDRVILLKGNHEYYPIDEDGNLIQLVSPADFYQYLTMAMQMDETGEQRTRIFSDKFVQDIFRELFMNLPTAVILMNDSQNVLVSHSGFIRPGIDIEWETLESNKFDYYKAQKDRYPGIKTISELSDHVDSMVWSELVNQEYKMSQGGTRKEIGKYSRDNFMDKFGFDIVVRGHEHPREGVQILKTSKYKIYTILSSGGFEDLEDLENCKSGIIILGKDGSIEATMINTGEARSAEKKSPSDPEGNSES